MNEQIMQQMMQMMMQNQQMMMQMMMMMQNPQQNAITEKQIQVNSNSNGNENEQQYLDEIASLKAKLEAAQNQIDQLQQEVQSKETQIQQQKAEIQTLKEGISKVEAFEGKSFEELTKRADNLSGDDYYELKKAEWNAQGLTGREKHDKISEYRDYFNEEEEKGLLDFGF